MPIDCRGCPGWLTIDLAIVGLSGNESEVSLLAANSLLVSADKYYRPCANKTIRRFACPVDERSTSHGSLRWFALCYVAC